MLKAEAVGFVDRIDTRYGRKMEVKYKFKVSTKLCHVVCHVVIPSMITETSRTFLLADLTE